MTASFAVQDELPIVLTATIVPNVGGTTPISSETRLVEYLEALKFYLQVAPVIFLENSGYPLENHAEFRESPRLLARKFPPSSNPGRGKGYQEFEMLDRWLASEPEPPARWLKITGRYRFQNIRSILNECLPDRHSALMIDQVARAGMARTYSFCVSTDFYKNRIRGLYQQCDDRTGAWIERILFRELKGASAKEVRFFKTQPRITAIAGSSSKTFPTGLGQWLAKQTLRNANRLVDRQYLWYPK